MLKERRKERGSGVAVVGVIAQVDAMPSDRSSWETARPQRCKLVNMEANYCCPCDQGIIQPYHNTRARSCA